VRLDDAHPFAYCAERRDPLNGCRPAAHRRLPRGRTSAGHARDGRRRSSTSCYNYGVMASAIASCSRAIFFSFFLFWTASGYTSRSQCCLRSSHLLGSRKGRVPGAPPEPYVTSWHLTCSRSTHDVGRAARVPRIWLGARRPAQPAFPSSCTVMISNTPWNRSSRAKANAIPTAYRGLRPSRHARSRPTWHG